MPLMLSSCCINSVPNSCMSFVFSSRGLKLQNSPACHPNPGPAYRLCKCGIPGGISLRTTPKKTAKYLKMLIAGNAIKPDDGNSMVSNEENTSSFDWMDEEDEGSPWEGAVVYKRSPSISHLEYCTTLERLGLGKLSSEVSRSRASLMGLRVTKTVKDYVHGTPVLVSVDVTRKKNCLRLDGIIRTVISLNCNRCCEPAAENVYSSFSLLLTGEPVEEPEVINMGVIYGEDKFKSSFGIGTKEEDDDDSGIDFDDRIYFPAEEKEIDISKHIRDLVHLEITINAICSPNCKGVCLKCGTNLNNSGCNCSSREEATEVGSGPLGNLRKQMQRK
ncbi:hypothetical protein Ancab_012800 [Ancistrocladus abbreviatus]